MTWRTRWAAAQITGVAVSSLIWLMVCALEPNIVAAVWVAGAALVAMWPSRFAFRLRYGGRRVSPADRLTVQRAAAPVQQLRGRKQPEVRVTHRPGVGLALGPRCMVVSHNLLDGLRSHRVTDLRFATLAARSVGTLAVTESRLVAAVGLFCLPWSLMERLFRSVVGRVPRPAPRSGVLRWVPWLVLAIAMVDLYQRGLWVALVMVVLVGVAMVTTGRCNRAWAVRVERLAEAGASRCGLDLRQPAEPDPWAFLLDDDEPLRRGREL